MTATTLPAARGGVDDHDRLTDDVRTAAMVWQRELIRYVRTRTRILTGQSQPLLFRFVLGYGMTNLVGSVGGFDFKKFVCSRSAVCPAG